MLKGGCNVVGNILSVKHILLPLNGSIILPNFPYSVIRPLDAFSALNVSLFLIRKSPTLRLETIVVQCVVECRSTPKFTFTISNIRRELFIAMIFKGCNLLKVIYKGYICTCTLNIRDIFPRRC